MVNFLHKNQIKGTGLCGREIIIGVSVADHLIVLTWQRVFVNHVITESIDQRIVSKLPVPSIYGINRIFPLIFRSRLEMNCISQEIEILFYCEMVISAWNAANLDCPDLPFITKMETVEDVRSLIILWITWLLYAEAVTLSYIIQVIAGQGIMILVSNADGLTFGIMQRVFALVVMLYQHTRRNHDDIVRPAWKHAESNRKRIARNAVEIEKGFAGYSSDDGGSALTARIMGQLLTWRAETKAPVMLVATANNVKLLPPELTRKGRFDELWAVGLPVKKERREIFAIHLQKKGRNPDDYDLDILAGNSKGFVGSEIESSIEDAMYSAFFADREFTTKDILKSVQSTVSQSVTHKETIDELMQWAKGRARFVSTATEDDDDDSPKPKSGRSLRLMKSKGE